MVKFILPAAMLVLALTSTSLEGKAVPGHQFPENVYDFRTVYTGQQQQQQNHHQPQPTRQQPQFVQPQHNNPSRPSQSDLKVYNQNLQYNQGNVNFSK
ncbi:unnamed protein product [Meganyctiphanes norvegica]|uniref:Uncharacterized protein n=1 Tax=Meganyctiphanes norvegica TaxID=48144 RepID=A0AAV2Q249_MEGNR